jgi:DNA-binding PadR family transcriptional regulator
MRELKKGSLGMLVLTLLRERPSYGYALCERLRDRTAGLLTFEDGAIYPLLHDYERQGFIEGYWETTTDPGAAERKGPRRRYYRVTPHGIAALRENVAEWRTFSEAITRLLGDPLPRPASADE